jgi:hypothetical protein
MIRGEPNGSNEKSLCLSREQIRPLATGRGSCFATDMITDEGRKEGFMYREQPDNDVDSGWRFMSGFEPQEYMDDPDNLAIYEVNTIAIYDPDIIPLVDAPIGSVYERDNERSSKSRVGSHQRIDENLAGVVGIN